MVPKTIHIGLTKPHSLFLVQPVHYDEQDLESVDHKDPHLMTHGFMIRIRRHHLTLYQVPDACSPLHFNQGFSVQ